MSAYRFSVSGKPATQGSKTAIPLRRRDGSYVTDRNGRIVIRYVDDCSWLSKWRKAVQAAAREVYQGPVLERVPAVLHVLFWRPRAKHHYGTGRNAGIVKPSAPVYPTGVPDTLKLARAIEDALTGVFWKNDSCVIDVRARKLYGSNEYCTEIGVVLLDGQGACSMEDLG